MRDDCTLNFFKLKHMLLNYMDQKVNGDDVSLKLS